MKASLLTKLESLAERQEELHALLADPTVIADQNRFRDFNRELAEVTPVVSCFNRYRANLETIEAAIIRYNPPFELQWLDYIPGGAMNTHFIIKLKALGENRTRFVVEESFEGRLVGIAGKQLVRMMPPQYEAM